MEPGCGDRQHLLQNTTYGHVVAWAWTLLYRRPASLPRQLRPAYWVLLVLAVAGAFVVVSAAAVTASGSAQVSRWLTAFVSVLVLPLFWFVLGFVVKSIIGDAARYLHVAPPNVQCRHEIRQAGLKVLNAGRPITDNRRSRATRT